MCNLCGLCEFCVFHNGSVVAFCVLYGFSVGFVIFLPHWRCALVARIDLFCVLWCVLFLCVFV